MTKSKIEPSRSKRKKKRRQKHKPYTIKDNMDMRKFDEEEKKLIYGMVNRYGASGIHSKYSSEPFMRKNNARFFTKSFVKKTISFNKPKLTKKGQKTANKIIKKI